jgi:hypothetical protein
VKESFSAEELEILKTLDNSYPPEILIFWIMVY